MPTIHLVERIGRYKEVDPAKGEWESGYWNISEKSAQRFVGGRIYLHPGQLKPAHIGGIITRYRLEAFKEKIRVVFTFRCDPAFRGYTTSKKGWGNEQKRVMDEAHD